MENKPEDVTPQNPVTEEAPAVIEEVVEEVVVEIPKEKVEISQTELDELKKNAEASSQNFERAKKAEDKLKALDSLPDDNQIPSDYDDEEVGQLKDKMSVIEAELGQSKLIKKHPELEEVWDDFESYHAEDDNKGMKLETAAKSFLIDKGLLETKRKGLEKVTGGNKAPQTSGMTLEQVEDIRKNDGKKYRDMLKKGQIKFKKS